MPHWRPEAATAIPEDAMNNATLRERIIHMLEPSVSASHGLSAQVRIGVLADAILALPEIAQALAGPPPPPPPPSSPPGEEARVCAVLRKWSWLLPSTTDVLLAELREALAGPAAAPTVGKAVGTTDSLKHCVRCGVELTGLFYGMGDGTGQKFGCAHCYWRTRADESAAVARELGRRVAQAEALYTAERATVAALRPITAASIAWREALEKHGRVHQMHPAIVRTRLMFIQAIDALTPTQRALLTPQSPHPMPHVPSFAFAETTNGWCETCNMAWPCSLAQPPQEGKA